MQRIFAALWDAFFRHSESSYSLFIRRAEFRVTGVLPMNVVNFELRFFAFLFWSFALSRLVSPSSIEFGANRRWLVNSCQFRSRNSKIWPRILALKSQFRNPYRVCCSWFESLDPDWPKRGPGQFCECSFVCLRDDQQSKGHHCFQQCP